MIGSHGTAEATKSLDDLYRVCEEFKKESIEVLGISGGDGTLHHTLTAMIKVYADQPLPLVAILRGGTMNTIAHSFQIRGKTSQLLFELVDKHRRGTLGVLEVFERSLLQIGDAYGFIFGNGVIYNFLDAYYKTGHPSPQTAARLIVEAVASASVGGKLAEQLCRRLHARVTVDGTAWAREDFITVTAAVVSEIGFAFQPFYRCNDQVGKFPVLGFHTTPAGLIAEMPRMRLGRPVRRDKVIDALAEKVVLESDEELGYTIDGDIYVAEPGRPLRLKTGPRVKFLRLTGDAVGEAPLPLEPPEVL